MPPRSTVVAKARAMTASALVAAGQLILKDAKGKAPAPAREAWQTDAWDIYDSIPEVGQAVTFMGNVVSGVQLFIAQRPDHAEEPPAPAEPSTPGAVLAAEILERVRRGSTHGGLGGLLAESTINLKVPGECFLVGFPERQAQPAQPGQPAVAARAERWDVMSTDEVTIQGERGEAEIKDKPGGSGTKVKLMGAPGVSEDDPDAVYVVRVWDRHPRFSALARSSLRSALTECDELLILSRAIRSAARSRYAGAGILAMDAALDVPSTSPAESGDEGSSPESTPFMQRLATAMVDPISDEGNPDAVVPIVIQATPQAGTSIKDMIALVETRQQFDPEMRELRKELLGRLGASLDIPIEELTGIAKVNHWGAWQISGSSWARYGQPTTRLIVESWSEGLLWPLLEAEGIPPEVARNLLIWFDPADAIMDPDESKTADELLDHWAIGFESYRRRKGAGEDEAPTEDDLLLLERRGSASRPAPGPGQGPPNDGEPPEDPAQTSRSLQRSLAKRNGHSAVVAARRPRQPLGVRLAEIDQRLRARLEEAAEFAMRRALSRAGARVRDKTKGQARIASVIAGVPNTQVCAVLGPGIVAAQELSEDDLLAGGIEEMEPRYEALVVGAQRRTRAELARDLDLSDAELDAMERQQEKDRAAAWLWLSGAMLGLARERLYQVGSAGAPGAPSGPEREASGSVPPSMLREATQRAGGGAGSPDSPAGGVATGNLVMDVWAQHGMVVGGWQWVHDEPDVPFPGHEQLDGLEFRTWDDPALLVNPEDDWLGVTHYRPGDHDGCRCDFVPLATSDLAPDEGERVSDLMEELEGADA